ncbi:hypothetical protein ACH5RR_040584 [Cinchona calisaya]|uniref:CTLH domain-containing protein n=1 Tax=Cinchona calisaya TaxID=153742 RepID=A0ABD2XWB2_9GENT
MEAEALNKDLVFVVLQFLKQNYKGTVHKLEKESGFFFNMEYFEECVKRGDWYEVENYISGFTKLDDNNYSTDIFFLIRKQKYCEALDKGEDAKALEILRRELQVFRTMKEGSIKELTDLLRENKEHNNIKSNRTTLVNELKKLRDIKSNRTTLLNKLKKLIEANPVFHQKLEFPNIEPSRLPKLISQSLKWQHWQCNCDNPKRKEKTLFVDHSCPQPTGVTAPYPALDLLMGSIPGIISFLPYSANAEGHSLFAVHQTVSERPMSLPHTCSSELTPTNNPVAASEHGSKRLKLFGTSHQVTDLPVNTSPVLHSGQTSPYQFPRMVFASCNQGSAIKSMDFHPVQQTLLLIGKENGNIALWDLERRAYQNFEVSTQALDLMASLANENAASVNRVLWSPDGSFCGVAYSKNVVSIYTYERVVGGAVDLGTHLSIDAHVGNVYDLAMFYLNNQLCIVTCGEDKAVKVWDNATGYKLHTFEGHDAAVYSVCAQCRNSKQYIISTAIDGKIKVWQCGIKGSIDDLDAPGLTSTKMAYSSDGTRLFSCGMNNDGKSCLVERNKEYADAILSYLGLGNYSRNRFLATGDEHVIKVWDMNFATDLTAIDAKASPYFRFNKEGIILAVSTSDNCVYILANTDGVLLLGSIPPKIPIHGASSSNVGPTTRVADRNSPVTSLGNANDLEKSKNCELT